MMESGAEMEKIVSGSQTSSGCTVDYVRGALCMSKRWLGWRCKLRVYGAWREKVTITGSECFADRHEEMSLLRE